MTYLFSSNVEVSNDQGNALPISVINYNGSNVNLSNPFPVTLGSNSIQIIGNISIPTTVNVASSPDNPIHSHITEVGTSGNLLALNIPYMPIGGNVTAFQGTSPWTVNGNIGVTSLGSLNISGTSLPVTIQGNANVIVQGNIAGITSLPPVTISGNVNVNPVSVTGITSNVTVVDGGGSITVDGNVGIVGNVNVTQGTDPWNIAGNVGITGSTTVAFPPGATSLLGELYSAVITPTAQVDALHGVDTAEVQTYVGGGGNVNYSNAVFECSSTSTVGSYAVVRTRDFNGFRPGESMLGRWLTKFGNAAVGTSQRIGLNNQEQGYYIGYNGTTFGILRVHGGQTPIYRVTITSYTGAQTVTLTLNSVAYTISIAAGETTGQVAQQICLKDYSGAWLCNQRDNTVDFLYAGAPGALGGTFSITSNGTMVASIATVRTGVAVTNTWYLDGGAEGFVKPTWLTPTNYNSYAIKYLWATAVFYAINFNTGQYEKLFSIGTTTDLPVANPTFKAATVVYNTGGNTAVTTTTAAMMTAVEGVEALVTNPRSTAVTHSTLASGSLWHLLSIQNPYTQNGKINTRQAQLLDLTVSLQCNDPSQIYIYLDAPLATGVHNFISQNSGLVSVSTAEGTVQDGPTYFPILSFIVGTTGSTTQFDLSTYRLVIPPGATISIAVYSTASINKAVASVSWYNI